MSMRSEHLLDFQSSGDGATPRTFGEYAETWFARRVRLAQAGVMTANSVRRTETVLAAHLLPFFAAVPLDELSRDRCERFRATLVQSELYAPRTINSIFGELRLILRSAIQDQAMTIPDPVAGIRPLATPRRRIDCYSSAELLSLLGAAKPPYRAMLALAGLAGLRKGEVLALGQTDIDLQAGVIHVQRSLQVRSRLLTETQRLGRTKTPAGVRDVPIRDRLRPILETHLERHTRPNKLGLAFTDRRGAFIEGGELRTDGMRPAIEQAGLSDMTIHGLRVCFLTHCAEAGVPMPILAGWAGHATLRSTDYYVHSTPSVQRRALMRLARYDRAEDE